MKKIILSTVAAVAVICLTQSASAHDSTGCGLGSMAWRDQAGMGPQILAATTNASFGTQTFGISTGTSGCDPNGRITGGTQKMFMSFLENNMEQYAFDASRGDGETIQTIAGILNVPADQVAAVSKEHFNELFANEDVEVVAVAEQLLVLLNIQAA